jgi:hypothetical protein
MTMNSMPHPSISLRAGRYIFGGAAACPSACGRVGSKQAQAGADFVQMIPPGLAMFGDTRPRSPSPLPALKGRGENRQIWLCSPAIAFAREAGAY